MKTLLQGHRVRLSAVQPAELSRAYSTWNLDSEFKRLLDGRATPFRSVKFDTQWLEKELARDESRIFWFSIRSTQTEELLGDLVLEIVQWSAGEAFVGLAIGDRKLWGQGYGTEAMQLGLQFAFTELNLRRVTLTVFEYNPRAIRSYEKAGFRHEGRCRQALCREGRRWDVLYMGILREAWLERQIDNG
jgi:RimJ/RimL family protein N-acetyltransferase